MTDQQDWDAAAAEAGYLPTSEYVARWAKAREAAHEALQTARELTTENERLREALETIQNAHVPDQPASRDIDPAEYILGHHTSLRRIAYAALQPKEGEG